MVFSAGNLQLLILQIITAVIRYGRVVYHCIIMANINSDFKFVTTAFRNNIQNLVKSM